jgi:predicted SnoaL-like aldol condensation-catalyzing enzyme
MAGFKAYFSRLSAGHERPIPDKLDDLVHIHAEGDYVTLLFVREYDDPDVPGTKYTTTWFDTVRIVDGKLVEHWDSAMKGGLGPSAQRAFDGAR